MTGEHVGIFGQVKPWDLASGFGFCSPDLFRDVEEILNHEEEERNAMDRAINEKELYSTVKKTKKQQETTSKTQSETNSTPKAKSEAVLARVKTPDLMKPTLNTWYSSTIFAKELVLDRIPKKRIPQGAKAILNASKERGAGAIRLYQHLDPYDLVNMPLPAIGKTKSEPQPPTADSHFY
jgi:hypothetical protein